MMNFHGGHRRERKPTSPRDYVKYGNAQSFLHFGKDPQDLTNALRNNIHETINGKMQYG